MIAWPEADAYFIDNIAIDPARQGEGLGRQLMDHAVGEDDVYEQSGRSWPYHHQSRPL
jgi:ribosomal protein S18 acetylase RimI-like enzyme